MMGLGCGCRQNPQVLGCSCARLGQVDSPSFDPKRDIVAGGVAFAVPWAYSSFAPKRWPKAGLVAQLGMVVVSYFGVRYLFAKSS